MEMRSTNSEDYQHVSLAIAAMAKSFSTGHFIDTHDHSRDQLLYAVRGIMRLKTESDAWIVPPEVAVYLPAGIAHSITMNNAVEMRSLYIDPKRVRISSSTVPRVIKVSPLLRELIETLTAAPLEHDANSRFGVISRLIEIEINEAQNLNLYIPLPRDQRLQLVCAALLENPSDGRTLEEWSEVAGASPRTIARLFKNTLGLGFAPWRQRVRFHNALEELSSGKSVSEVAKAIGYNSPSAFTAAFHKTMGFTPGRAVKIRQPRSPI